MIRRTDRLLQEIEAGALDGDKPLAGTLRKVIALGGRASAAEMSAWAAKELNGYGAEDPLPPYRTIQASLQIDAALPFGGQVRGQPISPLQLPDAVQEKLPTGVEFRQGIGEVEQMVRKAGDEQLKFHSQLMQDAAAVTNAMDHFNGQIISLYWSVAPTSLEGIVDKVRTALITLVAEIYANSPAGADTPSPEVATHALHVAQTGRGHKVMIVQAVDGSTVTTAAPEESRHWVKRAAGVVVGLVSIAGVVFALMQVQGWQFG